MKKIFLILCLLMFATPLWAANYYVKNGGDDNAAGSSAAPWATTTRVMATSGYGAGPYVTSGDTVYFDNQSTWSGICILTPAAGVTYDGTNWGEGTHGTSRAKFDRTDYSTSTANLAIVRIVNVSDVVVRGFEIDGNNYATGTYFVYGIVVGSYNTTSDFGNITIDNCYVHDACHRGIYIGGEGVANSPTISNVTISNTTVSNTHAGSTGGGSGLLIYPAWDNEGAVFNRVDGVTVTNCIIKDNDCQGIYIKDDVDNVVVNFCVITGNGGGAEAGHGFHLESHDDARETDLQAVTLKNSIIYGNHYNGIDFQIRFTTDDIGPINIYNNLIYNNSTGNHGYYEIACCGFSEAFSPDSVVNIYNNTIYNSNGLLGSYGAARFISMSATSLVSFINNIVSTASSIGVYDEENRLYAHSNNLIYRSSAETDGHVYSNGTTYDRDGTASDLTHWEETAKTGDPSFTGGTLPTGFSGTYGSNMVPNTDYFQLTVDSPAKDTGATLASYTGCINGAGLTTPITRPLGAAFDIGAYEYGTVAQLGGSAGSGFFLQGVTIR